MGGGAALSRSGPGAGAARPGLTRDPDFLKLWAGETISVFGSLVTRAALPFTAILVLRATPFHIGLLQAAELVPGFLIGLIAGAWVDRLRRRPLLIGADLGRALLLGSIPLAALLHVLRMEQLYAVAVLTGLLTLLFDVAYPAYLPSLIGREQLLEGNSRLAASRSVAEVGAFGLAGWLVQWFTAPIAILIDAVSFLVSAGCLAAIRAPEPPPAPRAARAPLLHEIRDGMRVVLHDPVLRALGGSAVLLELSFGFGGAVYMLFVIREVGFSPGALGLIFAVGGASSLAGSVLARPVARRLGLGATLLLGLLLIVVGKLLAPLAHGATALSAFLLIAQQLVQDSAATVWEIHQVSLRQGMTDDRVLGRVNATMRFGSLGAVAAGALVGGALAGAIGLRITLVLGAAIAFAAALVLALSPVRRLRSAPEPVPPSIAPAIEHDQSL